MPIWAYKPHCDAVGRFLWSIIPPPLTRQRSVAPRNGARYSDLLDD